MPVPTRVVTLENGAALAAAANRKTRFRINIL
jgi:hypothetical protein